MTTPAVSQPVRERDVKSEGAGTAIRVTTTVVVAAVAVFAAVVSYTHLYDLARTHGETGTAGRLLPLSVDGLIVAASLVMLDEARAGRDAPRAGPVVPGRRCPRYRRWERRVRHPVRPGRRGDLGVARGELAAPVTTAERRLRPAERDGSDHCHIAEAANLDRDRFAYCNSALNDVRRRLASVGVGEAVDPCQVAHGKGLTRSTGHSSIAG
jgi:hypothetical protein